MGYYSEACLCIKKDKLDQYNARLSLHKTSQLKELRSLLESAEHIVHPQTGDELWHWKTIKWYADYEDITFLENLMAHMDCDDYRFIGIGEDADDSEVRGCYWDNPFEMSFERNIVYKRPEDEKR